MQLNRPRLRPREVFNSQRLDGEPVSPECCQLHVLCKSCQRCVRRSRLLRGSWSPILRSFEKRQLHDSLQSLKSSVEAGCHLCTLVWEAIFGNRAEIIPPDLVPVTSMFIKHEYLSSDFGAEMRRWGYLVIEYGNNSRWIELCWTNGERKPVYMREKPENTVHGAQSFLNTPSAAHADLARYWLDQCIHKHLICKEPRRRELSTGDAPNFLPTRLLEVDNLSGSSVRLRITRKEDAGIRYCTLSRCWGGATDIMTLRSHNISMLQASIRMRDLPKTFRDAIQITRQLRVDFLWIDSLCIIQDSVEDWNKEAVNMGSIHENSACTIAAAVGDNPHSGLFCDRASLKYSPCRLAGTLGDSIFAWAEPRGDFFSINRTHLNTRAWVMQERLLSRRILYFTKYGIFWACREGRASERKQEGFHSFIFGPSVKTSSRSTAISDQSNSYFEKALKTAYKASSDSKYLPIFSYMWYTVIRGYSKCHLTNAEDKLIALSAIAQRIGEAPGFNYLAGLWQQSLELDLLWRVSGIPNPRTGIFLAPTWSWASVDSVITWVGYRRSGGEQESMAEVVSVEVTSHPADAQKTGQIHGGSLTLLGILKKAPRFEPAAEKDIFGNEHGFNLLDNGGSGCKFHPDCPVPPSEMLDMFLLPLRRRMIYESSYFHPNRRKKLLEQIVLGLAVIRSTEKNVYNRVGLFYFREDRKSDFKATSIFDGLKNKL